MNMVIGLSARAHTAENLFRLIAIVSTFVVRALSIRIANSPENITSATGVADPGVRRWLIACDESGVHGSTHYGFGCLWIKYQRRGDFFDDFRALKQKHAFDQECKWSTATTHRNLPFYQDLIRYYFQRQWLVFHCLVVRKSMVRKAEFHDNDWDVARRKHFTMLLTNKMRRALKRYPARQHEFLVYVDRIASRYAKADEAVGIISNNVLNPECEKQFPVKSVITRDSKDTPMIQLCDLLLGAVMETWQQKASNPTKGAVRQFIAEHLGWKDLNADTRPEERKFNIWYFFDLPHERKRAITSRPVRLKYPYPG